MNNNRGAIIARNTMYLYLRMALSMIVTLYTSRVILNALGASDFGIYNVVTGFVISFGFLNSAMNASVQRFLTVEFKKDNYKRLNQIFSMGVIIHLFLAILIIILVEMIGVYFLENKLSIPSSRLNAAVWIFHFSVISLFFSIINVPYKALIIAHEDMNTYAIISLLEVIAKLFIAFFIVKCILDKLIVYGFLLMIVSIVVQFFYMYYCMKKYKEGKFKLYWENKLFCSMSSFAGWNLIGVFAGIAYNQGVNIVLNIIGGPIVNAARAIAFQVSGAANQLVTNFQLAVNPPIMKAYATNDKSLFRLVISSCKLSYILLLFIVVPFILEAPFILGIWLKNVPDFAVDFARLALIDIVICSLAGPLHTLVQASGEVKKYQLIISGILLLNLPLSYFLLKIGFHFNVTFFISIVLSVLALITRFFLLKKWIVVDFSFLIKYFFIPITIVTLIIMALGLVLLRLLPEGFFRLIIICINSWVCIIILCWYFVLNLTEKNLFLKILKRR